MAFSLKKRSEDTGNAVKNDIQKPITIPNNKFKKEKSTTGVFSKLISLFKPKDYSPTKDARYAIIIGDEGAIITYIVGNTVQTRQFISSFSTDNLKYVETILAKNIKAPLVMIIDNMDQNFVQQTLPPISSMGVKKLINRRLDRDLGKDTVKGFVLLERDKEGRRDWNFLMVSLEKSPQLSLWFAFIEKMDNRLQGLYLLSVETENIIKHLDAVMQSSLKKNKADLTTPSVWKLFVTHNKVGGFRQVILKNGRIIFTRLSQAVGEETPEVIAGNIEQEMSSTIEYMKRLSFSSSQGLDIYLVASADINKYLDTSKTSACNVYKFTPYEVAEYFRITGAAQTTDQFGDVILSVAIATNKNHRLTLSLPQATKVNNLYQIMQYEKTVAGLILLCLLIYGGIQGGDVVNQYSQIEDLNQKKNAQQKRLDDLNLTIKNSGLDVKKINDEISLYKQLLNESGINYQSIIKLRNIILPAVLIKEISYNLGSEASIAGAETPSESIELILRFPDIASTDEAFSSIARKILKDIRGEFPNYKVVYTKLPSVFAKKSEAGELSFDKKDEPLLIEKTNLEATLLITKQPKIELPAGFKPNDTDMLIGLGNGGIK